MIVTLLHANGRLTGEELARSLPYSAGACRFRLRRLLTTGIRVEAHVDLAALGLPLQPVLGLKVEPRKIWEAVEQLKAHERVHFAGTVTGVYDIWVGAACSSTNDLTEFLETFVGRIDGVREVQMTIILDRIRGRPTLGVGKMARLVGHAALLGEIDPIDLNMIEHLAGNGRLPSRELARRVGVSYVSARKRLQRLQDRGVIQVTAAVDPRDFGFGITALVGLKVHLARWRSVAAALAEHRQFHVVGISAGIFDVLLSGVFRTMDELDACLRNCAETIEGIEAMHSFICTGNVPLVPPYAVGIGSLP